MTVPYWSISSFEKSVDLTNNWWRKRNRHRIYCEEIEDRDMKIDSP